MSAAAPLSAWLLGAGQAPSLEVLRTTRLAAYGYTAIPRSHPVRSSLRTDYIAALGRHQQIKREIIPLLRVWRDAGIDVLLFKGFHLAEFVYPLPGARFHGNVDLLIRRDQLALASRTAKSLGWHEKSPPTIGPSHSHEAFSLVRSRGAAMIDVHRDVIHTMLPWNAVQRRITDAAWDASRVRWWEGIDIRELCPVDMILVGLVLQRCWGADAWRLKPHDAIDYRHIASRYEVDADALEQRASELGCARTLGIFSSRCDPESGRLELGAPTLSNRLRWQAVAFPERGLLGGLERTVARLCGAPSGGRAALAMLPTVIRVRLALHVHRDMQALLSVIAPDVPVGAPSRSRADVAAAVRWAIRLAGTGRNDDWLVSALTLFIALREAGWPVDFVSGIRPDADCIVGHAWIEHDGVVLPEMDEAEKCATFAENFRFS